MARRKAINPDGTFLTKPIPKKVEFVASDKTMRIDGRTYRMMRQTDKRKDKGHWSKDIYVPVDERAYRKRVGNVADFLSKHVEMKDLMQEALLNVSIVTLEKLELRIKKHAKVKVVRGCYALQIGNVEIQLVD
jgi:hypothetical protein